MLFLRYFPSFTGMVGRYVLDRMEPQSSSTSGAPESAGHIEDKLQRKRERERACRASETVEQREERLRTRRTRDRARRAAQTAKDI